MSDTSTFVMTTAWRCLGEPNGKPCGKVCGSLLETHEHAMEIYHDKAPAWTLEDEPESDLERAWRTQ